MKEDGTHPVQEEQALADIHQMAHLIGAWHNHGLSQLAHLEQIPSGESITIQLGEDQPHEDLTLEGDLLKGFRAGMIVAMNIFKELPFATVPMDDDSADDVISQIH